MNRKIFLLIGIFIILLVSCFEKKDSRQKTTQMDAQVTSNMSSSTPVATPIIYEQLVRIPEGSEDWEFEKLEGLDTRKMVDLIFNLVYEGKVVPYEYHSGEKMTVEEIRILESEEGFERERIGKVQFEEDWYFDETNIIFHKKVHSILIAYEVYNSRNEVMGYKAGFVIRLN